LGVETGRPSFLPKKYDQTIPAEMRFASNGLGPGAAVSFQQDVSVWRNSREADCHSDGWRDTGQFSKDASIAGIDLSIGSSHRRRGQQLKQVAELVLSLNQIALAEGLHFAESFDMNLYTALKVLKSDAASSRVMDSMGPKMLESDCDPEVTLNQLDQHLTSMRTIMQRTESKRIRIPLLEAQSCYSWKQLRTKVAEH
jgi:hypothetical protein